MNLLSITFTDQSVFLLILRFLGLGSPCIPLRYLRYVFDHVVAIHVSLVLVCFHCDIMVKVLSFGRELV